MALSAIISLSSTSTQSELDARLAQVLRQSRFHSISLPWRQVVMISLEFGMMQNDSFNKSRGCGANLETLPYFAFGNSDRTTTFLVIVQIYRPLTTD